MKQRFISYGKFLFKMRLVAPIRAALLALFGPKPSRTGWETRMLVINLLSLGDIVMCTSVLKHYKNKFPDKKITLLIKSGTGLEKFLRPLFVDEIVAVDYRRFAANPWYGFRLISALRRTGFETVVNQDFSSSEIQGKIIATLIGAERIIGSDGVGVEYKFPFDIQQVKNLRIIERTVLPRYTTRVATRDMKASTPDRLPSAIHYYVKIFEAIAGNAGEYALTLPVSENPETVLKKFGLKVEKYAIMNVGASMSYKRWPTERFAEAAKILLSRGLTPVVIGTGVDRSSAEAFTALVPEAIDLVQKTTLSELIALIAESRLVFTNDTSTVHLAIALKKPSLCVTAGGQFGMQSNYGYSDINMWAYARTACYFDNFRCGRDLGPHEISPCMAAVTTEMVKSKLSALLDYLDTAKSCPQRSFSIEF